MTRIVNRGAAAKVAIHVEAPRMPNFPLFGGSAPAMPSKQLISEPGGRAATATALKAKIEMLQAEIAKPEALVRMAKPSSG